MTRKNTTFVLLKNGKPFARRFNLRLTAPVAASLASAAIWKK